MRVITGTARGRKLVALEGNDVRPTTDKVKESIFSMVQFQIPGAVVLDLFSGSGQLGIEALSRGASKAYFVDKSKASVNVITQNIETTGFVDKSNSSSFCSQTFSCGRFCIINCSIKLTITN